ncbi:MAG TPA: hypothetical protein VK841_12450 [Polyangiaceae bacterium]|jgi:hypothetical protein|nr:hypothetical protein [Polyangiaceae bacterium]
MPARRPAFARSCAFALLFSLSLAACKGAGAASDAAATIDGDPLALLPPGAVAFANVEVQSIAQAGSSGTSLAAVADSLVPLGADAGFVPSRDVDRIVLGEYGTINADVGAILSGRFDPDKIAKSTQTKSGAAITATPYLNFTIYKIGAVAYSPLTPHTLVAGTGDGVMRVLDRVHAGKLDRAIPPWAADTLQTKGAEVAVAADFSTHPIGSVTVGSVSVPWLKGMQVARVLGDFSPPGLNVAATLTYSDPSQASGAAQGISMAAGWVKMLAPLVGGANLENLDVHAVGADVQCKFAVDDQSLRMLVSLAPRLLPGLAGSSAP